MSAVFPSLAIINVRTPISNKTAIRFVPESQEAEKEREKWRDKDRFRRILGLRRRTKERNSRENTGARVTTCYVESSRDSTT